MSKLQEYKTSHAQRDRVLTVLAKTEAERVHGRTEGSNDRFAIFITHPKGGTYEINEIAARHIGKAVGKHLPQIIETAKELCDESIAEAHTAAETEAIELLREGKPKLEEITVCETCDGEGEVMEASCAGGTHTELTVDCPDCDGGAK